MTQHPPSYNAPSESSLPVPPYVGNNVTLFPSKAPCSLSLRNIDKSDCDIVASNLDDGDKLVFVVHVPTSSTSKSSYAAVQAKLAKAVKDLDAAWSLAGWISVSIDGNIPYVIRKSDTTATYEVVSLSAPFSLYSSPSSSSSITSMPRLGETRKLTTKTTLFKTKYLFSGPNGREWAWKGNVSRTLSLYEYPSSGAPSSAAAATANGDQASKSGSSTPANSKTLLAELTRFTNGAALWCNTDSAATASLILASLLPLLFTHRTYLAVHYTSDADLDRLQTQVRPSNWDAFFLSGGKGSEKQEKFKAQMEKERERERRERSQSRNRNEVQGVIPALPERKSMSRSRLNSNNHTDDDRKAGSSDDEDLDDKRGRQ
ncbi:uncharacterized protein PFL1_03449 [Pseudozyma flocculosa PF-1]|uniref:Uncharacterized protein n=2 Tax=Pseudozyma flocculosa TaxID=84751 RepID=A0A5C3FDK3_9BASI|nr:uncharacterized protein PFL1_03449 [Pseudozyma flocculosa PF-1]EPQ29162.1 hypothetical protein PFL1_03449 [Pseudozyma flocculosa PF-1]SPO41541.1 uncharacterized protein PSFLO_07023 [Pseudozyma flocculosa]